MQGKNGALNGSMCSAGIAVSTTFGLHGVSAWQKNSRRNCSYVYCWRINLVAINKFVILLLVNFTFRHICFLHFWCSQVVKGIKKDKFCFPLWQLNPDHPIHRYPLWLFVVPHLITTAKHMLILVLISFHVTSWLQSRLSLDENGCFSEENVTGPPRKPWLWTE